MITKIPALIIVTLGIASSGCVDPPDSNDVARIYGERAPAPADQPAGFINPAGLIAESVTVPAGYRTVYLSGLLPDASVVAQAPLDTQRQAENIFSKIGALLKKRNLSEADVVSMTVYIVAPEGATMDFQGMMRAYTKFYGTDSQPNRPARSTVQVAGLVMPGALLEIEVTAVTK